jgi:quinol monooxygenase YgiN
MSVTLFIKHKVSNFESWKKVYDEIGSVRKQIGVSSASVHRDSSDPNTVVVTHQFKDLKTATTFANSEDLEAGMKKAGVMSQPELWFAEDVERTAH